MSELYRTEGRGRLYNSITETVGDTPSVRLNRIAPSHVTMYVKVESFNPLASVKDRLALNICLLYTSPSPRDATLSRMPSSA